MTFRDNCVPLPQMDNQSRKRKLTKSDNEKANHRNGLVPNGLGKKFAMVCFFVIWLGQFPFSSLIVHLRKGHTVVSKHHGKKVKPNRRLKKNFLLFCPVSIVFCRGIRISLINVVHVGRNPTDICTSNAFCIPMLIYKQFCNIFKVSLSLYMYMCQTAFYTGFADIAN